jgi:hypothetical protein
MHKHICAHTRAHTHTQGLNPKPQV